VVDTTALEMRHTRKGIGGSNPSLSASSFGLNGLDRISSTVSSNGEFEASETAHSIRLLSEEMAHPHFTQERRWTRTEFLAISRNMSK
jgi:hypothetical protein